MDAQGLPAALAFDGFGKFQDNLRSVGKTTAPPAAFNQRLSTILDSDPRLPISAVMERLGSELVKYLDHSGNKLSLSAGLTETIKFITLSNQNRSKSKIIVLMLEGREKRGVGSDPALAILQKYNQYFHASKGSSGWANTYMPAIGVEIIGTELRIHALYFTNKALSEPLTGWVDYTALQEAQPQNVEKLARTMQALGELSNDISNEMAPHA